jgi:D-beta-D-heptose 7-phosphate kinase/D-beta-D-heptose 1-phosphate adenosyltransferase
MKIHANPRGINRILASRESEKVVFTNGVFDIIHPGHIQLLRFAKSQGDVLIVGMNSDASVKRLKGPSRPIFPLEERMEVLEEVEFVDYIIPFSEDTPLRLIQSISRIDVLVKGGDYTPEQVVGRDVVEASGGEVIIFKLIPDFSTTGMIKKIRS